MKKIIILVFSVMMTAGLQAQLNSLNDDKDQATTNSTILIPQTKKGLKNPTSKPTPYSPKSLTFQKNYENGLHVTARRLDTNLPIFISGQPELQLREGNSPEASCFNFLENAKGLMGIENPSEEFSVIKIDEDELGYTHVKLQQEVEGIPIYGAEVIYHSNSKMSFLNGSFHKTPKLDSYTPSIQQQKAEEITVDDVGGITKVATDKFKLFDTEYVKSELVIYRERLAYHFSVYKNIIDRWEYFVDANTGEIIDKYPGMCKFHNHTSEGNCMHTDEAEEMVLPPGGATISNALDLFGTSRNINTYEVGGTYYMIDASKTMYDAVNSDIPDNPVGAIWTIDALNTSPQNNNFEVDHVSSNSISFNGQPTGVSAQYNGGQAYLYFKNIHDRESINGNGGNVIGLINIADEDGGSLGNAFWNGTAMFYGNGDNSFLPLARGLDVAGHEMSHGVIQNTANLVYQGESGALNESFADVFGSMIDRDDWLIGEDVVKTSTFPSGALRSMEDPHNGAQTGNFNQGWQPKKYSERFTGSQDNGGVHINSGIPNHAFYLFANDPAVGKARAEKVYYRALDKYLTKSSQFIDARLAIVQAATDLYGANVANKAKEAFDEVEIFNGSGNNNQTDIEVNPGDDLILFTTVDQNNLYIADGGGNLIFNPLTEQNPISVPSITDDGTEIVFVNDQGQLYYIRLNWETQQIVEEGVLGFTGPFRNVVFSRDGLRMAALRGNLSAGEFDNEIFVFDWVSLTSNDYPLFNPTTIDTVTTSDVLFADAMEFDFTGEYLMYDAYNVIESTFGNDIDYWDIGFIRVFDNDSESFTLGTDIQKIFTQLPEGISVGNPTFSKNSDYIVAFDFIESNTNEVWGVNIETGDINTIYANNDRLGYPNYSNNDELVLFDAINSSGSEVIGAAQLEDNKIESNAASVFLGFEDVGVKWGVWFGNGDRVLSTEDEFLPEDVIELYPNPTTDILTLKTDIEGVQIASIRIVDMMGRTVYNDALNINNEQTIDISSLGSGQYVLSMLTKEGRASRIFIKQ